MPLDAEKIARLRELMEKATPGPWKGQASAEWPGGVAKIRPADSPLDWACYGELGSAGHDDVRLIVAMHTALPDLLACAEDQDGVKAERDALRSAETFWLAAIRSLLEKCGDAWVDWQEEDRSEMVAHVTAFISTQDTLTERNDLAAQITALTKERDEARASWVEWKNRCIDAVRERDAALAEVARLKADHPMLIDKAGTIKPLLPAVKMPPAYYWQSCQNLATSARYFGQYIKTEDFFAALKAAGVTVEGQ